MGVHRALTQSGLPRRGAKGLFESAYFGMLMHRPVLQALAHQTARAAAQCG